MRCSCKTILGFVALCCGVVIIPFVGNLFEDQILVLGLLLIVILTVLVFLLCWLMKKADNPIYYVEKNNKKVNINNLKDLKIDLFIQKYCKDNNLELDSVYSILINLCEYRINNMISFSFSNYFSILALFVALFAFLFADVECIETKTFAFNCLLLICILFTIIYIGIKNVIDREKSIYTRIRLILCRALINKKVMKKETRHILSRIIDLFRF